MQIKKSEKASLEGDKLIYALMGFVFVLSLCYVALEWTKTEVTKYEQADQDFQIEEELDIQQTTQEMTPPPPPPPAPEVVQEVEVLNVEEPLADELGEATVVSERYFDISGIEHDQPVDGVNIIIRQMSDGTTQTVKVMR